jgi:hypothetical protein
LAVENDFSLFAVGAGANVLGQTSWNTDPVLSTGFQAGIAPSAKFNKAWRQASYGSAVLAQFIANNTTANILDDGNLSEFVTNFGSAIAGYIVNEVTFQSFLSANTSFYVGGTGASDTNNGLTATTPWATFAHTVAQLKKINVNGYNIIVNCSGPFGTGLLVSGPFAGAIGASGITFNFAAGSSINVTSGNAILGTQGAAFTVNGPVTLSSSDTNSPGANGNAIYSLQNSLIAITGGPSFGACTAYHMRVGDTGFMEMNGNYTISGNSLAHWDAAGGRIDVGNSPGISTTVVLVGGLSFSNAFALVNDGSVLFINSSQVAFSGSATGTRYIGASNGIFETSGGGASYFPGTVAGTLATGAQYI